MRTRRLSAVAVLVCAAAATLGAPTASRAETEGRTVAVSLVDEGGAPEFAGLGRLASIEGGRVHIVDGFRGERFLLDGVGGATRVAWSGDGSTLAIEVGTRLYLYRYGDATVQWLPVDVARWEWSPQGAVLAWTAAKTPASYAGSGLNVTRFGAEWTTTPIVSDTDVVDFVWSQQQRLAYLTFERKPPGTNPTEFHALFTTDVAPGASPQRLTLLPVGRHGFVELAAFTLDGRNLLFWDNPMASGSIAADGLPLMTVPVDGGTPDTLGSTLVRRSWVAQGARGQVEIVTGGGRDAMQPRSLVTCTGGDCSQSTAPAVSELDPAWSVDGRQLAFVRAMPVDLPRSTPRDPLQEYLARYRARTLWVGVPGAEPVEVAGAGAGVAEPRWAVDGRHIVVLRDEQLWLVDIRGGDAVPVTGPLGSGGKEPYAPGKAAYEASDQYPVFLQASTYSSWFEGPGIASVSAQPTFTG
jgi:dipeptidyl aminopeptidase/acylaminoacyl peptidase